MRNIIPKYPEYEVAVVDKVVSLNTDDVSVCMVVSGNRLKGSDIDSFCEASLTFTALWASSADDKMIIFSYFSQKIH